MILYKEESYIIQGAIFEVYKTLGPGFLESVYQECLCKELGFKSIPCKAQPELQLFYKGDPILQMYRPDFVCYGKIILEFKSVNELMDNHHAQLHNYLRMAEMKLGLLVNFNHHPRVVIERIAL